MRTNLVLSVLALAATVCALAVMVSLLVEPALSVLAVEGARYLVLGGALGVTLLPALLLAGLVWRQGRKRGGAVRPVRTWLGLQLGLSLALVGGAFALADPVSEVQSRGLWLVEAFHDELDGNLPPALEDLPPLRQTMGAAAARERVADALAQRTYADVAPFLDHESAAGIAVPWAGALHPMAELSRWDTSVGGFAPLFGTYGVDDAGMWQDPPALREQFVPTGRDFLLATTQAVQTACERPNGPKGDHTVFPWVRYLPTAVADASPAVAAELLDYAVGEQDTQVSYEGAAVFTLVEEDGALRLHLGSYEDLASRDLDLVDRLVSSDQLTEQERRASALFEALQDASQ